jgi:hypothetical protein
VAPWRLRGELKTPASPQERLELDEATRAQLQAIRGKLRASSYFSGTEDWARCGPAAAMLAPLPVHWRHHCHKVMPMLAPSWPCAAPRDCVLLPALGRRLFKKADKDGNGVVDAKCALFPPPRILHPAVAYTPPVLLHVGGCTEDLVTCSHGG